MPNSDGRFNPPNPFSKIVWDAVWTHVEKQKTTNIIGLYNCNIFYSVYVSLITSYSNLRNTDNIEIYLTEGLEEFFRWARISKNRFRADSENFISNHSQDLIDPYINHFANLFFKEIRDFNYTGSYTSNVPYFMLLFEADSPIDDREVYNDEYFFECDISPIKIDAFFEIIKDNFKKINTEFDFILQQKEKLKLQSWNPGKVANMITDKDFFQDLATKPFNDARCQICGDFTLREELSLNIDIEEGWILPMCKKCKLNNSQ